MLFHNSLADRKAKPAGIAISAEARLEDTFNLVSPDAAAAVAEFD
jgi:hypothetical protein